METANRGAEPSPRSIGMCESDRLVPPSWLGHRKAKHTRSQVLPEWLRAIKAKLEDASLATSGGKRQVVCEPLGGSGAPLPLCTWRCLADRVTDVVDKGTVDGRVRPVQLPQEPDDGLRSGGDGAGGVRWGLIYVGEKPLYCDAHQDVTVLGEFVGKLVSSASVPTSERHLCQDLRFLHKPNMPSSDDGCEVPGDGEVVVSATRHCNEMALVIPARREVRGKVTRWTPNTQWHTVYVNGWPHIVLTTIPGVGIKTGDILVADFGDAWLQRSSRAASEILVPRLVQSRVATRSGDGPGQPAASASASADAPCVPASLCGVNSAHPPSANGAPTGVPNIKAHRMLRAATADRSARTGDRLLDGDEADLTGTAFEGSVGGLVAQGGSIVEPVEVAAKTILRSLCGSSEVYRDVLPVFEEHVRCMRKEPNRRRQTNHNTAGLVPGGYVPLAGVQPGNTRLGKGLITRYEGGHFTVEYPDNTRRRLSVEEMATEIMQLIDEQPKRAAASLIPDAEIDFPDQGRSDSPSRAGRSPRSLKAKAHALIAQAALADSQGVDITWNDAQTQFEVTVRGHPAHQHQCFPVTSSTPVDAAWKSVLLYCSRHLQQRHNGAAQGRGEARASAGADKDRPASRSQVGIQLPTVYGVTWRDMGFDARIGDASQRFRAPTASDSDRLTAYISAVTFVKNYASQPVKAMDEGQRTRILATYSSALETALRQLTDLASEQLPQHLSPINPLALPLCDNETVQRKMHQLAEKDRLSKSQRSRTDESLIQEAAQMAPEPGCKFVWLSRGWIANVGNEHHAFFSMEEYGGLAASQQAAAKWRRHVINQQQRQEDGNDSGSEEEEEEEEDSQAPDHQPVKRSSRRPRRQVSANIKDYSSIADANRGDRPARGADKDDPQVLQQQAASLPPVPGVWWSHNRGPGFATNRDGELFAVKRYGSVVEAYRAAVACVKRIDVAEVQIPGQEDKQAAKDEGEREDSVPQSASGRNERTTTKRLRPPAYVPPRNKEGRFCSRSIEDQDKGDKHERDKETKDNNKTPKQQPHRDPLPPCRGPGLWHDSRGIFARLGGRVEFFAFSSHEGSADDRRRAAFGAASEAMKRAIEVETEEREEAAARRAAEVQEENRRQMAQRQEQAKKKNTTRAKETRALQEDLRKCLKGPRDKMPLDENEFGRGRRVRRGAEDSQFVYDHSAALCSNGTHSPTPDSGDDEYNDRSVVQVVVPPARGKKRKPPPLNDLDMLNKNTVQIMDQSEEAHEEYMMTLFLTAVSSIEGPSFVSDVHRRRKARRMSIEQHSAHSQPHTFRGPAHSHHHQPPKRQRRTPLAAKPPPPPPNRRRRRRRRDSEEDYDVEEEEEEDEEAEMDDDDETESPEMELDDRIDELAHWHLLQEAYRRGLKHGGARPPFVPPPLLFRGPVRLPSHPPSGIRPLIPQWRDLYPRQQDATNPAALLPVKAFHSGSSPWGLSTFTVVKRQGGTDEAEGSADHTPSQRLFPSSGPSGLFRPPMPPGNGGGGSSHFVELRPMAGMGLRQMAAWPSFRGIGMRGREERLESLPKLAAPNQWDR
ncbi:unnamed protein product [Vitrella brassicaformis CCMP3155]|uniref:Uncharacterized protein n=3 Tax=Vitrella brassicaformis TaxID=1169539 RepID=A0A0G4E981_VITBC|nr:unnamed protein product [Vitrella brassicaformis CCMP3155]|eukprot:CEL92130.1 unnamed protein product [Vitrella brassicaformis CCMP3155]